MNNFNKNVPLRLDLTDHQPISNEYSDSSLPLLSSSFSAGGASQSEAKRLGTPSKRDELLTAATQFFEQQDVTQFFTMTFVRRMSGETARHVFGEWIDGLEWFQRRPLGWLRAEETKRWSGLSTTAVPLHFHGLLIAAPNLNIPQAEALARELAGDTLVVPYQRSGGATPYSLKHAFEKCGDYEIGGMKAFRRFVPPE